MKRGVALARRIGAPPAEDDALDADLIDAGGQRDHAIGVRLDPRGAGYLDPGAEGRCGGPPRGRALVLKPVKTAVPAEVRVPKSVPDSRAQMADDGDERP